MSELHVAMSGHDSNSELRQSIERQTGELVRGELNRCDDEWRRTVASMQETLAGLQRACDGMMSKDQTTPSDNVPDFVERLVKAAADEAERAAERIRAEADLEIAAAKALISRLESELDAARQEAQTALATCHAESAARAQAEAAWRRAMDAHREESATLAQRLSATQSEHANLLTMLESVKHTLQSGIGSTGPFESGPDEPRDVSQPAEAFTDVSAVPELVSQVSDTAPSPAPARPVGPESVESAARSTPDPTADPAAYAVSLLEIAETKHKEDVGAGFPPLELIDRLTANLRDARNLFGAQAANMGAGEDTSVFDEQLMQLLDTHGTTDFGRHLGIAAYELFVAKAS